MSELKDYPDPVRRDGFVSSHGKFTTQFGNILPVRPEQFGALLLPTPIPAVKKALKVPNFVRAQLTYYGVEFDESEISGDGFELLKTSIKAGKFSEIPNHIQKLEADMHQEWINKCTVEQLSGTPQWLLQKYFMSNGLPDRTKTKTVVAVLYPKRSRRLPGLLTSLAKAIPGLEAEHMPTMFNQVVFLAWDLEAVHEAYENYWKDEREAFDNAGPKQEPGRDKEQHKAHKDYLDSLSRKKNGLSPVGSYIVGIEQLERLTKDKGEAFMEIYETDTPGLYQADFDFKIMDGIMMMSTNQHPFRYFFKHRCRESWDDRLFFIPRPGHIEFDDGRFCTFTGQILLPCSREEIPFTGYKISDKPPPTRYDWDDFEEEEGLVGEPPSFYKRKIGKWAKSWSGIGSGSERGSERRSDPSSECGGM